MLPKIQSNTAIHVIEWSFESENPWLKNCDIVKYGWRRKWIQLKMIITRFYTPFGSGGLKANELNWNLSFDILLFQQFLIYFNFCKFSNQGFQFQNFFCILLQLPKQCENPNIYTKFTNSKKEITKYYYNYTPNNKQKHIIDSIYKF